MIEGRWISSLVSIFVVIEQFIQFVFISSAQAKHHVVNTKINHIDTVGAEELFWLTWISCNHLCFTGR